MNFLLCFTLGFCDWMSNETSCFFKIVINPAFIQG